MSSRSSLMLLSVNGTAQSYGVIPERTDLRDHPVRRAHILWTSLTACLSAEDHVELGGAPSPSEGCAGNPEPFQGCLPDLHRSPSLAGARDGRRSTLASVARSRSRGM